MIFIAWFFEILIPFPSWRRIDQTDRGFFVSVRASFHFVRVAGFELQSNLVLLVAPDSRIIVCKNSVIFPQTLEVISMKTFRLSGKSHV